MTGFTLHTFRTSEIFSILHRGRRSDRQHHLLHTLHAHLLRRHAHADGHVVQQRRVALVGGVRVARNVRRPLVLGRVGVARADVFVLE